MTLHAQSLASLDKVRAFLDGTVAVVFTAPVTKKRYRWLEATLHQFHNDALKLVDEGLPQPFPRKVPATRSPADATYRAVAPQLVVQVLLAMAGGRTR